MSSPLSITSSPSNITAQPSFNEALRVWMRIGLLSFGGPTAQIGLMHRILVDEKKWIDEERYLNALSFCMLLPGPEAMQLATYVGWRQHGLKGGLAAGLLFVLPGALVVLTLAAIYAAFGNVPFITALFLGIKAAVVVIVIEALLRIARKALKTQMHWMIAGLSFVTIYFLALPFPLIVFGAGLFGYFAANRSSNISAVDALPVGHVSHTMRTVVIGLAVWFIPLAALAGLFGGDHILTQLSLFFSKLAVVTFGGAYAVLAYMAQDVVGHYRWLDAGAMMDGLGLAETTPGPLILVTEFVGYLAAYRNAPGAPLTMGLLGAVVALWATFAPCFLWIFAGAPYLDWIIARPRLKGALAAISAAVVGVILNLAIWFALHVFFQKVELNQIGPLHLWTPQLTTLDWRVAALSALSGFLLLKQHWSIPAVLFSAATIAALSNLL